MAPGFKERKAVMDKKNIVIGTVILAAAFGMFVAGTSYWTGYNDNKNKVMAEVVKERGQAEAKTVAAAQPAVRKEGTASHNPAIAIKQGRRYKAKKAELKEKVASKKAAEKKRKKAQKEKDKESAAGKIDYSWLFDRDKARKGDDDRYLATLSGDEKKAYEAKIKKNKKKKLIATKKTVPDRYEEQTQGNTAKVDRVVVRDKDGKEVKDRTPKADWNDIVNSCLKDKDGNWIDNSEEASNKRYAKKHGLTVEEVETMRKNGYFYNGTIVDDAKNYVGDGSPEDDAGMDFQ